LNVLHFKGFVSAMTTKRAYKLQEFVAHSAAVNCLKIGRKSSRVLVTGGEDHKVNLWAIGKPNAILVSSRSTVSLCVGYKLVECFYGIHSF
jgi:WD40 repeat protein